MTPQKQGFGPTPGTMADLGTAYQQPFSTSFALAVSNLPVYRNHPEMLLKCSIGISNETGLGTLLFNKFPGDGAFSYLKIVI